MIAVEQTVGCLLGLSLGDAFGARYEGGVLERLLWRWIGTTRQGELRWTDDTQMAIDLGESYLATGGLDQDDLAVRFATSYRWSRGYGPGTARVLRRIAAGADWRQASRAVHAGGSYGNGAAMRAPVIGLIYAGRPDELAIAAEQSAVVTHAHPLAIEGAVLIAGATAAALRGDSSATILESAIAAVSRRELTDRLNIARNWLESGREVGSREIVRTLGNGVAAQASCVTAVYLALLYRGQPLIDLLEFTAKCGGDTDTISAMAGAIWGAANGRDTLPEKWLSRLEQRDRIVALGEALHGRIHGRDDSRE